MSSDNNQNYKDRYEKVMEKALKITGKSVIGFFIKNYRFTYLLIFFIIVAGFYSAAVIPREAEPEIRVPFAVVTTIYPGANPTDIEELVTDKIEDEIKNLNDLKIYTSGSSNGVSSIFVEFTAEADLEGSFKDLQDAVNDSEPSLPDEAETPIVTEINFNDFPIVTYSLTGDFSEIELKEFADILQNEFESIKDVSKAPIIGGLEREFQVYVNQAILANYNISLGQIVQAISLGNFSLPAGDIEIDKFKYNIRVKGRFESVEDIKDIVVATNNDSPIFLRDIAQIKDGYKERQSESRIGFSNQESRNTISLQVFKATGGNILNIVDASNQKIAELFANQTLSSDLQVEKTNDNSIFIKDDLRTLGTSAIQTIILITLILMVVLSLRGAIITALAVPMAFLMAFIFLYLQGLTLNSMVLFSLVLSLGLMVDNAIIIIEGINEYVSEHKKSILDSALLSVWNFKWAITAGTMTTVSAFLPMLIVSGILGEYLAIIPKTITVTLLSSLVIALVIIPTLATRFIKRDQLDNGKHHRNKKRHLYIANKIKKLKDTYKNFMVATLPNKKKRRKIIATAWIFFLLAVLVPATGLMKIELFSQIDIDYFFVNIELPVGSTLESTNEIAREVEKYISLLPGLENYVVNVGASAALGFGDNGSSGTHLASFTVNLVDKQDREKLSFEIAEELRESLKPITNATITVNELNAGPPTGSPIEVRIFGEKLKDIDTVAAQIEEYFKNQENVINVRDSLEAAAGEFTFSIDKQKANYYGLDITTVAANLRQAIFGVTATEVNLDGEDIDVTVKYADQEFSDLSDLEKMIIFNQRGEAVSLKELANVKLEPSLLTIDHRDGQKVALVNADIETGANLANILKDYEGFQNSILLPPGVDIQVGGEVEDIEQSFRELFLSMGLAVLLIAFILVLQFNSFRQPLIIIFSVPLAFIGVILGLNILRMPFSFTAFIGIVSLSGIVVNDAIVLIDRINKNIDNGMEFFEAIVEGGLARMQPIFLTSITTIAGVFPLIYASELWRGLSISIIFGLIFSTFLILIIIPLIYAGMCYGEKCAK